MSPLLASSVNPLEFLEEFVISGVASGVVSVVVPWWWESQRNDASYKEGNKLWVLRVTQYCIGQWLSSNLISLNGHTISSAAKTRKRNKTNDKQEQRVRVPVWWMLFRGATFGSLSVLRRCFDT